MCLCVLRVVYRVEFCDLLFSCNVDVIVWFVGALVCDGVWCVCAFVWCLVSFVRFVLLCSNLVVCFVWDVLCDDEWFVFVCVFV